MFRCLYEFFFSFVSLLAYIHWSSIKFWQRFDEGVRFSKRRFAGDQRKRGVKGKFSISHFRPRSKRETWTFYRKIHKGTRHDQTSF